MNESFEQFQSPFSWRYGSEEMRRIWSEVYKRQLWRRLWVALAEAQIEAGFVTPAQVTELRAHVDEVDMEQAHAIEAEIHHDLMAEVRVFASQCPNAGGIIHLGATSMDIEDNADALRLRESLSLLITAMRKLLTTLADQIETRAEYPCMAYTHIQPAEITTVGYRLAQYAQDFLVDFGELQRVCADIRGKGFTGAVGTSASYKELVGGTPLILSDLQQRVMESAGLEAFTVSTQTYPRKQDWRVLSALAGIASSLSKFALDLRVLQSPSFGEMAEPFGAKQVGSSAMPFKRNPINAEKICSLGRLVASQVQVAWENASHSILERTLDDSANRRTMLPESFLAVDEMIAVATRIIKNLRIDESAIARNLSVYGRFSAVERVLMALGKAGANRQEMHEVLREHSLAAWAIISQGAPNPLVEQLATDERLLKYLPADNIRDLMDYSTYVGDAPQRAKLMAKQTLDAIME
ncbi:MAG: adenylosuccinate lyase [Chloroflexi bacterium]|nr:adenylosuccinate lyase [Chloroflexota bacterium]